MNTWNTEVKFVDGVIVHNTIVTTTDKSARRAARKLAINLRPYAGTPVSVSVQEK